MTDAAQFWRCRLTGAAGGNNKLLMIFAGPGRTGEAAPARPAARLGSVQPPDWLAAVELAPPSMWGANGAIKLSMAQLARCLSWQLAFGLACSLALQLAAVPAAC